MRSRIERLYALFEARDWDAAGELMTEDVVYELPQSRERVRGRGAYLQFNRDYPGDWHLSLRRVVVEGRQAMVWIQARVGGEIRDNLALITFDEQGLVERLVDFWPEPYAPPPDRPDYVEHLGGH